MNDRIATPYPNLTSEVSSAFIAARRLLNGRNSGWSVGVAVGVFLGFKKRSERFFRAAWKEEEGAVESSVTTVTLSECAVDSALRSDRLTLTSPPRTRILVMGA